jgi:proline iminopeptidase
VSRLTGAGGRPARADTAAASMADWLLVDSYLDNTGRADRLSGGVRMIAVSTPAGRFRVWTKRFGNNPRLKVLLLHGGPGATHEYLEPCDGWLPQAGVEYYYYDQLGSHYSDRPDDPALWEVDRFVDEVEQVRVALGLDRDSFVLYGQSWGGALAIEYALAHQEHLKGLVVSNMMASIPAYNDYAERVLMPAMDQAALAEIKQLEADGRTDDPRYESLLMEHHYVFHVLRMPAQEWPEPVVRSFAHINPSIYVPMQGPSELGASGKLLTWDRRADLSRIRVPTLVMGAQHDTMDPDHLRWMASQLPQGRYHHCPDGSHLAIVDDQETYFEGLVGFLEEL